MKIDLDTEFLFQPIKGIRSPDNVYDNHKLHEPTAPFRQAYGRRRFGLDRSETVGPFF